MSSSQVPVPPARPRTPGDRAPTPRQFRRPDPAAAAAATAASKVEKSKILANTGIDEDWDCDIPEEGSKVSPKKFVSSLGNRDGMYPPFPSTTPSEAHVNILPSELTLMEIAGTGCTADVYRGTWCGKEVAIKQIVERSAISIKEQVAFTREIEILVKVSHENLVKLYGVCFAERPLRIITEYCGGGACFELLHNRIDLELSALQQLKMCYDVAHAMCYLHNFTPQIIHRDLKSLNLLLMNVIRNTADIPWVKVSDFGVARVKDMGPDAIWGKMTLQAGTKHWMAPEMWSGTHYDEKVDVFSYAMVVYEILCREVPFQEEDPSDVGKYTLAGIRPGLEAVPPGRLPELTRIMTRCWVQDPKARPRFDEIVKDLEALSPPHHRP